MAQWGPSAVPPYELRRENQLGGLFVSGCPLPEAQRRKIVELALSGLRAVDISRQLKVSNGSVSKILTRYYKVGIVQPKTRRGSRPRIATPRLVAGIAQLKQEQPSLFAWEIREKLEAAGICPASRIPSVSSINRILRCLEASEGAPFLKKPPQPGPSLTGEGKRRGPAEALTSPASPRSAGAAGPPRTRSRTVFSKEQLEALESTFQRSQYLEAAAWAELAGRTGLPEATLRVSRGRPSCTGLVLQSESEMATGSHLGKARRLWAGTCNPRGCLWMVAAHQGAKPAASSQLSVARQVGTSRACSSAAASPAGDGSPWRGYSGRFRPAAKSS